MKRLLSCVIMITSALALNARIPVVVVGKFVSDSVSAENIALLRSAVVEKLSEEKYIRLVDADLDSLSLADSADYRVTGEIFRMTAVRRSPDEEIILFTALPSCYETMKSDTPYYCGNVRFALAFERVDGLLNKVEDEIAWEANSISNVADTPEEALLNTVRNSSLSLRPFIDNEYCEKYMPAIGKVESYARKGKSERLVVSLGPETGVVERKLLEVFEIKHIAGRRVESSIADLKVTQALDETHAECEVVHGKKELEQAVRDGVLCYVRPKMSLVIL